MSRKTIIGITHGDINGVGYEVIMKTFQDARILEMCTPVVYGSPKVAAYHKKALNMETFNFNAIRAAKDADSKKVNIINCIDDNVRVELGKTSDTAGESSYLALEAAIKDLKAGFIDALVTAPMGADNIKSDSHSELLAHQFNTTNSLTFMVSEMMKVGLVTGNIPVSGIANLITKDSIVNKLKIMSHSLVQDFSINKPRIAVLGLNPHAGDGGLFGNEEINIIIPAIQEAKEQGILAVGPYSSDGFFGSGDFAKFDGILAMYHDQGMIPFKMISFSQGVNYTAGLPVIATSAAHGTALDIAGEGTASPDSFRSAIYMALDICKNRAIFKEISKNPLKKYDINPNQIDESIDLTEEEPVL